MFYPVSSSRLGAAPLAGLFLVTLLGSAGCDPDRIADLFPDGLGSSGGKSGGSGGGATGGHGAVCVQTVLCVKGFVFDSSPGVCACVPPPPPAPTGCAAISCPTGTRCEENAVMCVTAPCPPVAACVPLPSSVFCGGIAGIQCPGSGKCVDDPSDSCDPKNGGADCGGVCTCIQTVACVAGAKFDNSPKVCACASPSPPPPPPPPPVCGPVCDIFCQYGHVLDAMGCPTCACNPPPPSDPCATVRCMAGTHCEANAVQCVKAPCPPVAACVPDAPKVTCGGIANLQCPGGGKCVDDPTDSCDPKAGGADCGGVCQCIETVLCVKGAKFDPSPKVCACVPSTVPPPPPPTCGPVCQIFCQYGNVLDAKGCPTCSCNPAPVPPVACAADQCKGPAPLAPTVICADGTTAGPACVSSGKGAACGWTVTTCPPKS